MNGRPPLRNVEEFRGIEARLLAALLAEGSAEQNYWIRQALQDIVILTEARPTPHDWN